MSKSLGIMTNMALIEAKKPLVMYITGGGLSALGDLTHNGGASSYLLEAKINYAQQSTNEILGYVPKHYASVETARALALKAYDRATIISNRKDVIGLASTSKLAIENERIDRKHEIHIAIQTENGTFTWSATPNSSWRVVEDNLNSDMILEALRKTVSHNYVSNQIPSKWSILYDSANYPELYYGSYVVDFNEEFNKLQWAVTTGFNPIIFPGSFNPIHKQHLKIANLVYEKTGKKPWLELGIYNTDKPTIDAISLRNRIEQIKNVANENNIAGVVVTNRALFIDKVLQHRNPTFVVGSDTINRVFDPKYYTCDKDLRANKSLKFMVFQRQGCLLRPEVLNNNNIVIIPHDEYLDDGTSSTLIRNSE